MNDKRIKLGCPFCGFPKDKIQVMQMPGNVRFTYISCAMCGARINGNSKQEVIDKWNKRI